MVPITGGVDRRRRGHRIAGQYAGDAHHQTVISGAAGKLDFEIVASVKDSTMCWISTGNAYFTGGKILDLIS